MGKLRTTWQKVRDAAGLPQGFTKTSMGDTLDKWSAALKATTGGKSFIQVPKTDLAKAKDAAVTACAAAYEYRAKLAKEKNLKTFSVSFGGDKPSTIPYTEYSVSHLMMAGERKTTDPMKRIVAFLNDVIEQTYVVIHYSHAETALLKACPEAKPFLDYQKDVTKGIAEEELEFDRKRWQGHRDGAGLKPGFTKLSVGDKIDAYLAATKAKKFTKAASPAEREKMAAAAGDLYEAASLYLTKLKADPKLTGKEAVKLLMSDLEKMALDCQRVISWVEQTE